jgi:hypothetical protein
MQRLKIALPDELRAQLDAASTKSGRSVAEEIRSRVEATFALETVDRATRDFIAGVARMPAEVELETGAAWHKHAGAWAVFRAAILSRLQRIKPKGATTFGPRPHQVVPGDDRDFEAIGVMVEYHLHETPDFTSSPLRRALEQSHREIMKLHQQRQAKGDKS